MTAEIHHSRSVCLQISSAIRTIHLVCDNASTHHGEGVTRLSDKYKRSVLYFMPEYCPWMNQAKIIVRIFQCKHLCIADLMSKGRLRAKLKLFICKWNQYAHAFNWSMNSLAKVVTEVPTLEV
jgi:hypothetical protein